MGSSSSKAQHQSDTNSSSPSTESNASTSQFTTSQYPKPRGDEYDKFETLVSTLPKVIESENLREIEEYIQACDKGKGPAVACFSTAEYLSLVDLNHEEACTLYENTCFRPKHDPSPNLVEMEDGTKAYPPACFNLARFRMTVRSKEKELFIFWRFVFRFGVCLLIFLSNMLHCSIRVRDAPNFHMRKDMNSLIERAVLVIMEHVTSKQECWLAHQDRLRLSTITRERR